MINNAVKVQKKLTFANFYKKSREKIFLGFQIWHLKCITPLLLYVTAEWLFLFNRLW